MHCTYHCTLVLVFTCICNSFRTLYKLTGCILWLPFWRINMGICLWQNWKEMGKIFSCVASYVSAITYVLVHAWLHIHMYTHTHTWLQTCMTLPVCVQKPMLNGYTTRSSKIYTCIVTSTQCMYLLPYITVQALRYTMAVTFIGSPDPTPALYLTQSLLLWPVSLITNYVP